MKNLILTLACLLCVGCAQTSVYRNGACVFKTQANASLVVFHQADTDLRIDGLNHAIATRAGGASLGTGMSGIAGIATVIATRGALK